VHGTQVTVAIAHTPLWQVLEALADQLSFTAQVEPSVAAQPISVTFTDLPSIQALDRLLVGTNYAWTGAHLLVWPREVDLEKDSLDVGSWTRVTASQPSAQAPPSLETLRKEATNASDPTERLFALHELVYQEKEADVLPLLLTALHDADPQVRAFAMRSLDEMEETIPLAPMADVALYDPLAEYRQTALKWLAERDPEAAIPTLEQALGDQDDEVLSLAQTLLEKLQIERDTVQLN